MHALENGAVVLDVWENYAALAGETEPPVQPEELSEFLDKVYAVLEGAAPKGHTGKAWAENGLHVPCR